MTPEQRALRDAYLQEMWPVVRELPIHERTGKRIDDRKQQRDLEERAFHTLSPVVDRACTGNPETACGEPTEGAA